MQRRQEVERRVPAFPEDGGHPLVAEHVADRSRRSPVGGSAEALPRADASSPFRCSAALMMRWWKWGSIRRPSPPMGRVKKLAPGRMTFVEVEMELKEGEEESLRRTGRGDAATVRASGRPPQQVRTGVADRGPVAPAGFSEWRCRRAARSWRCCGNGRPSPADPAIHLAYGRLLEQFEEMIAQESRGLGGSGPRRGTQDACGHAPPPFRPSSLQDGAARLDPFVQRRVQVARGRSRRRPGPRRRQGEPPTLPVRDLLRRMLRTWTTTSSIWPIGGRRSEDICWPAWPAGGTGV